MDNTYFNKVDAVVNEISLEGLDGITLQGLWVRLSECTKIPLPFTERTKLQYWYIVCSVPGLDMFELEKPRSDLVIYDRFKYIDAEFGVIYYEPDDVPEDIYPHCPVHDTVNGIRGSSSTYHTRTNITNLARTKTLLEAVNMWGNKLIIVASQEMREFALMGRPKIEKIELSLMSYCLLEIIGRSRYHGEITQGKRSLQRLGETAKTLFYHRKSLLKHNLITKQMYHQKCGQHNYSGSLFHLTMYYVERKPKSLILTEQIVALLKTKPKYRMRYDDLPKDSAISANMKRLFILPEFQRFVKIDVKIPYRDMYPNAPQSEWKQKGTGREKHIRIFELIDPNVNVYEKWMHTEEKEEEEEINLGNLNYDEMSFNVNSILYAYSIINKYGPQGLTQLELGKEMGMTRLSSRAVCRTLLRRNAVVCVPSDFGRHRVTKFVCKQYMRATKMQFDEEKARVLSMLKNCRNKPSTTNTNAESSTGSCKMKMEKMYHPNLSGMIGSSLALFASTDMIVDDGSEIIPLSICQTEYPYEIYQDNNVIEIEDSNEDRELDLKNIKSEYFDSMYQESQSELDTSINSCDSALLTYRDKPPAVHKRIKEILNTTPINIEYPSKKLIKKYSIWFENIHTSKLNKTDVEMDLQENKRSNTSTYKNTMIQEEVDDVMYDSSSDSSDSSLGTWDDSSSLSSPPKRRRLEIHNTSFSSSSSSESFDDSFYRSSDDGSDKNSDDNSDDSSDESFEYYRKSRPKFFSDDDCNNDDFVIIGPRLIFANCEIAMNLKTNQFIYKARAQSVFHNSNIHTSLLNDFLLLCFDKDGNQIKSNISQLNAEVVLAVKNSFDINLLSLSLMLDTTKFDSKKLFAKNSSDGWKVLSDPVSCKLKQMLSEDIKVALQKPSFIKDNQTNEKLDLKIENSITNGISANNQQIHFLQNTNLMSNKTKDDIKVIKNLVKLHNIENTLQSFETYLCANNNIGEMSDFIEVCSDSIYTLDRNLLDNFSLDFLVEIPTNDDDAVTTTPSTKSSKKPVSSVSKKRSAPNENVNQEKKKQKLEKLLINPESFKKSYSNSVNHCPKKLKSEKIDNFGSEEDILTDMNTDSRTASSSDEIDVRWTIAEMVPGIKPCTTGLAEQLLSEMRGTNPESSKVSFRILRRANIILEAVESEKVIVELWKLKKLIQEVEHKEGYNIKIDKKSLIRLLLKLSRDGYIKFMKATLSHENKVKNLFFTCHPNIDENNGIIQSALEQTKMKFFLTPKKTKRELVEIEESTKIAFFDTSSPFESNLFDEGREELRAVSTLDKVDYIYERSIGKAYGYSPKFIRMKIIHEYLFYLIYEKFDTPLTELEEINCFLTKQGIDKDGDKLLEEMSTVYHKSVGWKMFIPPIPRHKGWPVGWTLACDVLLRLPLSIFVKCFNVPYLIEDLAYYLNHPVRQHFLVKNLPAKIRSGLMYDRKYIFSLHEVLCKLCYIGLLQFGPQRLKEKDQVFIFLNRKTCLLNTVPSKPGYHETSLMDYEKTEYVLHSFQDLEHYWYELWSICVNTSLGGRTCVEGQYIILEQLQTKPAMMDALLPRASDEAPLRDLGEVPGDKRGAAGFDSALFAHLKRNWNWKTAANLNQSTLNDFRSKAVKTEQIVHKPAVVRKHFMVNPKALKKMRKPILRRSDGLQKRYRLQKQKIIRKVIPRRNKCRKPFYDDKDKLSLQLTNKVRIGWTTLEDNILLLCTVGSIYLCPNRHKQIISFSAIRDVLHKMISYSNCKTSRSCQRRIAYIMKNSSTRRSVNTCLEEVSQNAHLKNAFGVYLERSQNGRITSEKELNILFIKLISYISRQFHSMIAPLRQGVAYILPPSLAEFKNEYLMSLPITKLRNFTQDPHSLHDINFNVVKNIIHSSMCCAKDKCSWAYQLFKVYKNYPEALLRSVICSIRRNQMVSLKKSFVKSHRLSHYMPLTSSPFQLSISYVYQMQTKYRHDIYTQAYDLIADMSEWIYEVRQSNNDSCELSRSNNGIVACMVELLATQVVEFMFEIPEQVIVLDPKIENDDTYSRLVKRYHEIMKDPNLLKEKISMDIDEDEENYPIVAEDLVKTDTISQIARSSSRIAFYMMRAEMCEGIDDQVSQHIHDYFVVNACKVFISLPEVTPDVEKWRNANICRMLLPIKLEICDHLIKKIRTYATISDEYISGNDLEEYLHSKSIHKYDIRLIILLSKMIQAKGFLGLTVTELWNIFPEPYKGKLGIRNIIETMLSLKIIIRVGVDKVRFVHNEHKKPWVVKSYKINRLDRDKIEPRKFSKSEVTGKNLHLKKRFYLKELKKSKKSLDLGSQQMIKVLISPWIRIDGTLNRRVLDRWLTTVLSTCLYNPGMSLYDVTHQFNYLNPVDATILVECLMELECIKMIKCCKEKCTLWSDVPDILIVPATGFENPGVIYIEPCVDAVTKLSLFIGEKAYGVDFLT